MINVWASEIHDVVTERLEERDDWCALNGSRLRIRCWTGGGSETSCACATPARLQRMMKARAVNDRLLRRETGFMGDQFSRGTMNRMSV